MKFLLLASFVLFCTASTVYTGRNIAVSDDGSILITSQYGRRVTINKQILPTGEKNIDITISETGIPARTIQIGENTQIGNQVDFLAQILREYQGVVSEAQYGKLLYRINQAVAKGQLSPQVYQLLESLDLQSQDVQYGQGQQQQVYGYGLNGAALPWYQQQYPQQYQQQYPQQYQQQYAQQYPQQYQQQYPQQYQQQYSSQVPQGQQQVYGYGLNRAALPWYQQLYTPQTQYQQQYYNQIPSVRSYGGYASSRYVNPLLERIFSTNQGSYINDLLANQQLNGGVYGNVPQTYFSRVFGRNYGPLSQYYQQGFYGQRQTVPQVYGIQQTLKQYKEVPQFLQQQQQQQIQQAIQQQQTVQQVVQEIEQLVESQQQEQAIEQLQQQQVTEQLQQQQQQQQVIEQLQQQQQQQVIEQLQQQQQQQVIEQLQQQQQQYSGVPLSFQQLIGAAQTVGQVAGLNSYYYRQPLYRGYGIRQPYNVQGTYFNTVPQVQAVY